MKWNESGFRPSLCTYRLNWASRTSWGWWDDWDDTVLQTQDSKFEPWRSEAEHATSRSQRLPTILTLTRGWGRNIFVSFKPPRPGTEPRTLAWKAAVLTTTLGPPPITLLSCLGQLFSNLINHRLTLFVYNNNIIGPEQAGFRAVFLTTDHMFAIKTLIDLYNHKRKKIFCCFVDYSKAFDSISRTKLWHKLLESNISGKIFILVHNMYKTAKSCVTSVLLG